MQIERITLAVTDMEKMVSFYNNVFNTQLQPSGEYFYRGTFVGFDFLLCPNDIAQVEAKTNRHQMRLTVHDVSEFGAWVKAAGGTVINEGTNGTRKIIGVRDPEGNSYELIEANS